jgi:anthranilate/para-aminobenzoate synthase component II
MTLLTRLVFLQLTWLWYHFCHSRFLCENHVLVVCVTQDQLLHTYGPKVFTDNQMLRIKYNYSINKVSKDYDDSQANQNSGRLHNSTGTTTRVTRSLELLVKEFQSIFSF